MGARLVGMALWSAVAVAVAGVAVAGDVCPAPDRRDCESLAAQMVSCQTTARSAERHGGVTGAGYGTRINLTLGGANSSETVPCTPETVDQLMDLSIACADAASGRLDPEAYWVKKGNLLGIDYIASCMDARAAQTEKKCGRKEAFDGVRCRPLLDVEWKLVVESLNVTQSRRADGTQWDNGSLATSAPDIALTVALTQTTCDDIASRTRLWGTTIVQDSFRPAFGVGDGVGQLDADSRLCIVVNDSDMLGWEGMHSFDLSGKTLVTLLETRGGELVDSFGRLQVSFTPSR